MHYNCTHRGTLPHTRTEALSHSLSHTPVASSRLSFEPPGGARRDTTSACYDVRSASTTCSRVRTMGPIVGLASHADHGHLVPLRLRSGGELGAPLLVGALERRLHLRAELLG